MKNTNSISLFFFLILTALEVSFVQSAEPASDVHETSEDPTTEKHTVEFYCDHCDTTFATSQNYLHHTRINNLKPEFICSACKKKFGHAHALKGHALIHTGEKPYECLNCKGTFRQQSTLTRHQKRCGFLKVPALLLATSSLKPSETPTPPRKSAFSRFVPSALLPAQVTTLSNDTTDENQTAKRIRLFPINLGTFTAPATEPQEADLQKHFCRYCRKYNPDTSNNKRHERTHTGARPYSCPSCERTFANSSNRNKHQRICVAKPNPPMPAADSANPYRDSSLEVEEEPQASRYFCPAILIAQKTTLQPR